MLCRLGSAAQCQRDSPTDWRRLTRSVFTYVSTPCALTPSKPSTKPHTHPAGPYMYEIEGFSPT